MEPILEKRTLQQVPCYLHYHVVLSLRLMYWISTSHCTLNACAILSIGIRVMLQNVCWRIDLWIQSCYLCTPWFFFLKQTNVLASFVSCSISRSFSQYSVRLITLNAWSSIMLNIKIFNPQRRTNTIPQPYKVKMEFFNRHHMFQAVILGACHTLLNNLLSLSKFLLLHL